MKKWNQPGALTLHEPPKRSRLSFTFVGFVLVLIVGGLLFWFRGPNLVGASSRSPENLIRRAEQRLRSGDRPGALADLTKVLAMAPDNARALSERADLLAEAEQYEQAIADYTRLIDLVPDHPEYHQARAAALTALGHFCGVAAARAAVRRALARSQSRLVLGAAQRTARGCGYYP